MNEKKFIRIKEHREELAKILGNITFKEKKQILKKTDQRIISSGNRFLGNERVHSIDYLTKFPNEYRDDRVANILHLMRNIFARYELDNLFKEKRKKNIKPVKYFFVAYSSAA